MSCITSGNLWLISLFFGGEAKREYKWVQTAGAFLVARSDGGPQGLAHQPLVLLPLFRQKPTGEKAGRPLRQRDQMVREVKSTAHSVSATLSVTWATVLMPVQPTGVRWAWGAVLLRRPPLWGEIGLPVNHTLSHTHECIVAAAFWSVTWLHLFRKLKQLCYVILYKDKCRSLSLSYKCPALANWQTQHWSFLTELKEYRAKNAYGNITIVINVLK